jgi:hypothetical protein
MAQCFLVGRPQAQGLCGDYLELMLTKEFIDFFR